MEHMLSRFFVVLATVGSLFKSRRQLTLENLALRQQLAMLKPSVKRPQVSPVDRLFWVLFSKYVDGWRAMLHALHPDTVVRWHRQGFRIYWRWKRYLSGHSVKVHGQSEKSAFASLADVPQKPCRLYSRD